MAGLETPLTRRRALQLAGGLGLAAVISACASDGAAGSETTAATTAEASTETAATAAPDCVLMPELTEGPTTSISTSYGATSPKAGPGSPSTFA